jgi:glycosyltransferase involved in cell wall biosynthesis
MAEAMLIGKPTIATGYSGNLEFMSHQNSLLVKYDMIKLDRDFPPYKVGSRWARASLKHAAQCMRRVQSQPDWGRALGARAKQDLEKRLSFAACGKMIKTRLEQIDLEISSSNHPRK